ncbi:hypothetical protein [Nocardia sp. XZ_19_369]|uniref:hypothetical protein n=1 Tax=Nocardia sp. XZ_19_369 TaxID=2769487 RepID=UPI00188F0BD5|nr:hypothetical protein [Nocardia sp. XZ_19_369]
MAKLIVDPAVYSSAGASLYSFATTYHRTFSTQIATLRETADMGGNVGESKAWATSYDSTVTTAMSMTQLLVTAMSNYAGILNQLGYNHALADYVEGTGRPEPTKPANLYPAWSTCLVPPPSAGGPGSGLFDDVGFAVSALENFGVSMPDGEPHDLLTAADAWDKLASSESGVGNLPTLLDQLAKRFESETAPDAAHVDEDIRELKASAEGVLTLYKDLAKSCRDHRSAILEFRTQLGQLLVDLAKDLAQEVAETVVLGVIAGALTAGFGAAAVAAAKAGKLAVKMKKYVDRVLAAKRAAKFVDKVTETGEDLAARRAALQRIADLMAQRTAEIARVARDKLKSSLDYALDKEAMGHVFVPKHKLDDLVKSLGGQEATMRKFIESVQGVPDGVYNGANPLVRTINGQTVEIRGAMIDGVFKIGTAYIP